MKELIAFTQAHPVPTLLVALGSIIIIQALTLSIMVFVEKSKQRKAVQAFYIDDKG